MICNILAFQIFVFISNTFALAPLNFCYISASVTPPYIHSKSSNLHIYSFLLYELYIHHHFDQEFPATGIEIKLLHPFYPFVVARKE